MSKSWEKVIYDRTKCEQIMNKIEQIVNKMWMKMNFNVSSGEIEWKFDENNRQKVAEVSKNYLKLPKNFLVFWWFWGKN